MPEGPPQVGCQLGKKSNRNSLFNFKKNQPKTIMVFSSTQTIPGISHSTPTFSRSGGHLHWQRHLNGQPKKNSSSHGFWLVMSSLVWDQGLQSCVYVHICSSICVDILYTSIRAYIPFEEPSRQSGSEKKSNGQNPTMKQTFHSSSKVYHIIGVIFGRFPNLEWLTKSGCCSTPIVLRICSSISREDGHLLLICSSRRTVQKWNSEQKH